MGDYCSCGCGKKIESFLSVDDYASHLAEVLRGIMLSLSAFEPGDKLIIEVVFKGEYRIHFDTRKQQYRSGVPHYWNFSDAIGYAANARAHMATNELPTSPTTKQTQR